MTSKKTHAQKRKDLRRLSGTLLEHIAKVFRDKFVSRFSIFLFIQFFFVPFLFRTVSSKYSLAPAFSLHFLHVTPFLFAGLIIFGTIVYRKGLKFTEVSPLQMTLFSTLAVLGFFSLFYLKYLTRFLNVPGFPMVVAFILVLSLASALSLFLTLFDISYSIKLFRVLGKEAVVMSFAFLGFLFSSFFLQSYSFHLSRFMASSSYSVLRAFSENVQLGFETAAPFLRLEHFEVYIGPPCSGVDSLALFLFLFLVLVAVNFERFDKLKAGFFLAMGSVGILLVGVLRIASLLAIGAYVSERFATEAFHQNAGWTFFVLYFFVYLWIVFPFLRKKN